MSDQNEQQRKADMDLVNRHVNQLAEQFDSVQIFVTRHMPAELDGTRNITTGSGNWFTRVGQIKAWVTYTDEKERESARQDAKEAS